MFTHASECEKYRQGKKKKQLKKIKERVRE